MVNEKVENVMSLAFELARIREMHGAQSGAYLSEVKALRAEVTRLTQVAAPQAVQAGEYPPLPRHGYMGSEDCFTVAQMRAYIDADRAAAQVDQPKRVTADAVRMLTEDEIFQAFLAELQQPGGVKRTPNQIVQHAFCRVNRGRVIPADGEVRG